MQVAEIFYINVHFKNLINLQNGASVAWAEIQLLPTYKTDIVGRPVEEEMKNYARQTTLPSLLKISYYKIARALSSNNFDAHLNAFHSSWGP